MIVLLILNFIHDVDGVCSASHIGRFATGQIRGKVSLGTHTIGGWVGTGTSLGV